MLVLLPIPGSSLQACFSGPYVIQKKVSDHEYLIAIPDLRHRSRLCRVNMLKPYHERGLSSPWTVSQPILYNLGNLGSSSV